MTEPPAEPERGSGPAYVVRTPRLLLRCWDPADAPALRQTVIDNLEHLRAWMEWAMQEPQTVDEKMELLRRFRGEFDHGANYFYGVFTPGGGRIVGGIGLMKRAGPGALEIGYWMRSDATGRGLATEAAAALVRVAFEVEKVGRVEIHCDPANERSARIPARLGFVHEATLRRRGRTPAGEPRDSMVWSLFDDAYPTSPAARAEIEALDALGRRLV